MRAWHDAGVVQESDHCCNEKEDGLRVAVVADSATLDGILDAWAEVEDGRAVDSERVEEGGARRMYANVEWHPDRVRKGDLAGKSGGPRSWTSCS
eukprot:CCRYP_004397-RD/>CCRYP_004397-RD protein AED:0.23 eAED:0.23 QI:1375/0.5/0.66/1/0.5/0.33/3/0/94